MNIFMFFIAKLHPMARIPFIIMRLTYSAASLFIALLTVTACSKNMNPENQQSGEDEEKEQQQETSALTKYYVNYFGRNLTRTYYLWNDEISDAIDSWSMECDPVSQVKQIRYKDSSGKEIDEWSQMSDNYSSLLGSISGTEKTIGADVVLYYYDEYRTKLCAVVTYCYPDSPAQAAGLKRGDLILKIGGNPLTTDNYASLIRNGLYGGKTVTLELKSGDKVLVTPKKMYEDPVLLYKVFDCSGKKVGYLHYTSFTQNSWPRIIEAADYFRNEGISELILDLRYNGGGYVVVESALASMLAPQKDVANGSVYEKSYYNATITSQDGIQEEPFKTSFSYYDKDSGQEVSYSTDGHNIGISKLYVITGRGTASASESIVTGLLPYLDITLVGETTAGKFCTGMLVSSIEWYEMYKDYVKEKNYNGGINYTQNWGMYLMVARFADKNGNTPCMPDGFTPDCPVADNPMDGYPLGNPEESMLAEALRLAGYSNGTKTGSAGRKLSMQTMLGNRLDPNIDILKTGGAADGLRIVTASSLPSNQVSPR